MALNPQRNDINALRLLFAIMVIVGHGSHLGFGKSAPTLGSIAVHAVAVDGFFVMSGYLITQSWLANPLLGGFLLRRAARIYPAFWACLIFTAGIAVPALAWLQHTGFPGDSRAAPWATF